VKDINKLKKEFADGYEFSIVVLASVPEIPEVDKLDIPNDERLQGADLTSMFLHQTIPGIIKNSIGENYELIIVDNGSSEEHLESIYNLGNRNGTIRFVLNEKNLGVGPGWNSGLRICRGKYICIVSNDFIVKTPNFLRILQKPMLEDNKVVITGPQTAQLNNSGMSQPLWRLPYVDYSAVNLCMFKHSFLKEVGYLDDNFYPLMFEDADIGWTANERDYKVMQVDTPDSFHWGSSTTYRLFTNAEVDEIFRQNKEYLLNKHKNYLEERVKLDERYK